MDSDCPATAALVEIAFQHRISIGDSNISSSPRCCHREKGVYHEDQLGVLLLLTPSVPSLHASFAYHHRFDTDRNSIGSMASAELLRAVQRLENTKLRCSDHPSHCY